MGVHIWPGRIVFTVVFGIALATSPAGMTQDQPVPSRADYDAARQAYAVALESGDLGAISAAAEAALEAGRAVLGESTRETAELYRNVAAIRSTLGLTVAAREAYGRAIDIYREIDGENSPEQIPLLIGRASVPQVGTANRLPLDSDLVERALELQRLHAPDDLKAYAALAIAAAREQASPRAHYVATDILDPLFRDIEDAYGENSVELVPVLMLQGRINATPDDPRVQNGYIERAIEIAEAAHPDDVLAIARLELEGGQYLLRDSDSRIGERYVERGVETIRETLGTGNETTARAELALGEMFSASRDFEDAAEALESAAAFFMVNPGYRMELLRTLAVLIDAYKSTGDDDKAAPYEREFVRLAMVADNQETVPLFRPQPQYPQLDINSGGSGTYVFRYKIDTEGRPKDAVPTRNGSATITEAALEGLARFRFLPRVVNGEPVETEEQFTMITFDLRP